MSSWGEIVGVITQVLSVIGKVFVFWRKQESEKKPSAQLPGPPWWLESDEYTVKFGSNDEAEVIRRSRILALEDLATLIVDPELIKATRPPESKARAGAKELEDIPYYEPINEEDIGVTHHALYPGQDLTRVVETKYRGLYAREAWSNDNMYLGQEIYVAHRVDVPTKQLRIVLEIASTWPSHFAASEILRRPSPTGGRTKLETSQIVQDKAGHRATWERRDPEVGATYHLRCRFAERVPWESHSTLQPAFSGSNNRVVRTPQAGKPLEDLIDEVNSLFKAKAGRALFHGEHFRATKALFSDADNSQEFFQYLLAIGALIDKMDVPRTQEGGRSELPSIDALDDWLKKNAIGKAKERELIISNLRTIKKLRNRFAHFEEGDVTAEYRRVGLEYPIRDYTQAWRKILAVWKRTLSALVVALS